MDQAPAPFVLRALVASVAAGERGRHLVAMEANGEALAVPVAPSLVPAFRRRAGRLADVALVVSPLRGGHGVEVEAVGLRMVPTGLLERSGHALGRLLGRAFVLALGLVCLLARILPPRRPRPAHDSRPS